MISKLIKVQREKAGEILITEDCPAWEK